jgi:hypothetical protein
LTLCPGRLITGKETLYPLYRRLGEGGGAEPVWTSAENLDPPLGFDPWTVQPVAIPTELS